MSRLAAPAPQAAEKLGSGGVKSAGFSAQPDRPPPRRPGLASHWTIPDDPFLEPADEEEQAIASAEYTDAVGIWTGPPRRPDDDTSDSR